MILPAELIVCSEECTLKLLLRPQLVRTHTYIFVLLQPTINPDHRRALNLVSTLKSYGEKKKKILTKEIRRIISTKDLLNCDCKNGMGRLYQIVK